MVVIYNQNGTIDLMATREIREGNLTEEDMEDMLEEEPETVRSMPNYPQTAYEEFWADPCWAETPGHLG